MDGVYLCFTVASLLLIAYLSLSMMGFLSWGNKFPVEGRVS